MEHRWLIIIDSFDRQGANMLILTRKVDESIVIDDYITITILEAGDSVRVGIEAPRDIEVHREEVYRRIIAEAEN